MGRGRSPSPRRRSPGYSRSRYSRSPKRDYSPRDRRRRSRSPRRNEIPRGRYYDGREKPEPCPCLGVFGMSLHTTERDLKKIFTQYGEVESVQIVYDRFSGRSRGFGFVYFTSTRDANKAKDHLKDAVIDGMKVRVDYSVTRGGGPYRHQHSRSPRGRGSRSPRRRSPSRSPLRSPRDRSHTRSRSRS
ncbi:RNA recognition motif domain-containing protein [Ditylenchus destructor]|uniref:RNA recognition motif domain-containing protein n=1 Tax=Ditylenchus destructor TaxID=166010 RepID=A0AAD4QXL1_9BILA|nr:RNA recognition motif domain-containing protein [Ditylenchus destructor]